MKTKRDPVAARSLKVENGGLDIVAPGKEGLYLFENLGNK
ncbi:hypothetical protein LCGC14_1600920 [marine sediment metagenome]|uniref:Uncharacterized protein n=1 Tax=marine sediment metagenome TaxID=412755 RepID=A0A0F9KRU5_9ZZZZ